MLAYEMLQLFAVGNRYFFHRRFHISVNFHGFEWNCAVYVGLCAYQSNRMKTELQELSALTIASNFSSCRARKEIKPNCSQESCRKVVDDVDSVGFCSTGLFLSTLEDDFEQKSVQQL